MVRWGVVEIGIDVTTAGGIFVSWRLVSSEVGVGEVSVEISMDAFPEPVPQPTKTANEQEITRNSQALGMNCILRMGPTLVLEEEYVRKRTVAGRNLAKKILAERAGFEPARSLRPYTISSRARSAAPAPLQHGGKIPPTGPGYDARPGTLELSHYRERATRLSTGTGINSNLLLFNFARLLPYNGF